MAKGKSGREQLRSEISATLPAAQVATTDVPTPPESEAPASAAAAERFAPLILPRGQVPKGVYVRTHVDAKLNREQALTMREVLEGLQDAGARLANGRRVTSPVDVVRYVLDQLASSGPPDPGDSESPLT